MRVSAPGACLICALPYTSKTFPACCSSGRCRKLSNYKYYTPHCCCAEYYLQAESFAVSPPLSPVVTFEDLAVVASEMEGGAPRLGQQICPIVPASDLL